MLAPSDQLNLQETSVSMDSKASIIQDRALSAGDAGVRNQRNGRVRTADQVVLETCLAQGRLAFHQGEVFLGRNTVSKLFAQPGRRLARAGKWDDTCHRRIQATDDPKENTTWFLVTLFQVIFRRFEQARLVLLSTLNDPIGLFVDDQQVIVLEEDM
jgi:hypothetical protein